MAVEDAKKFVDLVSHHKELQDKFREGWHNVTKMAAEHGLHVTREDLQHHLRERWGITKPPTADEKDTCTICVA